MTTKSKIDGTLYRRASIDKNAIQNRTVELSFSSEQPVLRSSFFDEPWLETLGHDDGEPDLSRLNDSAPLLWNHQRGDQPLGVVEKAWLAGGKGHARVRFSKREAVDAFVVDLSDGILRNVSVGYQINERALTAEHDNEPNEYRVTRWTPMEISIVDIPADSTVGVGRAFDAPNRTENYRVLEMNEKTQTADEIRQEIFDAEAERVRQLDICFNTFRDQYPALYSRCRGDMNCTVETARELLLTELGRGVEPITGPAGVSTRFADPETDMHEAMADALAMRQGIPVEKPSPAARDFQNTSLSELARITLGRRDFGTAGASPATLITRAISHASGDFPNLLANVAGKSLQAGFENEPASHRAWVHTVDVDDFKEQSRVQRSSAPDLLETPEGAEFQYGSFGERNETYSISTFGRIFSITRQALINDDLSAFSTLPQAFGQAGARLEADKVYSVLTTNAAMADGTALFHADHNNLAASGAALSSASLAAARAAMRKQTGLNGGLLNVVPRFLIIPAALEQTAEELLASMARPGQENSGVTNVFQNSLELVVEPRLDGASATAWYLASSWGQVDHVEVGRLAGQRGIFFDQQLGWEVDGTEFKARLDFGTKAIDWRGLYKNAGA